MKRSLLASLVLILITFGLPINSYANEIECPNTWNFQPTTGEISILNTNSLPTDFFSRNKISIESFNEATELGQQFLVLPAIFSYLPTPYYQKIQQGGRNIAVSRELKTSLDGKTWLGTRNYDGEYYRDNSTPVLDQPPAAAGRDRLWPTALASRIGLTPGTQVSLEVKINVNGCKEAIFYERNAVVPSYKVETRKLDNLLDLYYRINPSEPQINFLAQQTFNKAVNTFADHLRNISEKSPVWTISNTRRGILDIFWTLNGESTSDITGSMPFINMSVSPTNGDGCFTLTTPYKSVYTYKTLKYPCSISIDLFSNKGLIGAFEVARFEIKKLKVKTAIITCTNGKTTKKVSGTNPKCPKGYKKAG